MSASIKKRKQKQVDPRQNEAAASSPMEGDSASANVKATKIKKPEKIKLRRIHVSGLPSITEQEAKDRFKSFGEVASVDGLGKLDGNGHPLQYAFLNIKTTKSKLAQCMNLLSGSMWKGSTLRISEARSSTIERLSQEREVSPKNEASEAAAKTDEKKSKKRRHASKAQDTESASAEENLTKKKSGWKLDPKTHTPIFPIVARPDHPLPPPPPPPTTRDDASTSQSPLKTNGKASATGKSMKQKEKESSKAKEKEIKKKSKKSKEGVEDGKDDEKRSLSPPSRAKRVKIDPTKWQQQHLREEELAKVVGDEKGTLKGKVNKLKDSKTNHKMGKDERPSKAKETGPSMKAVQSETMASSDDESEEEEVVVPTSKATAHAVKDAAGVPYDEKAREAERKANLDMVAKLLGTLPTDLPPVEEERRPALAESSSSSSSMDSSSEDESDVPPGKPILEDAVTAPSAPDQIRTTTSQSSTDESDSEVTDDTSSNSSEPEDDVQADPQPAEAIGAEAAAAAIQQDDDVAPLESATSSDSDEESELEAEGQVVGLEQAATAEAKDEAMDSEAHDATQASAQPVAEVQMQSLTDMFKPQEASSGFILGDILDDFDMDELEVVPIRRETNAAQTTQHYQPWSTPQVSTAQALPSRAESGNGMLFFPFPLPDDDLPGGLLYGMSEQERERALSRSWTGISEIRRFKRTQTIEEITAQHESIRRSIGEQVRKRHREAVRTQKRHGGKRAQGVVDDN